MGNAKMSEDERNRELKVLRARVTELEAAEAERERAEEALLLAQFTVDHAAMATFWIGKDARLFRVNDAACRALGYSREELLSMTVHDFDPGFPRERWPDHWKDLRQHGSLSFESHHRAKDGRVFPVEIFVNHLEFKGQEYNVAFARDITDRKQAEEALRESEARYRNLFDRVPVGLYRSTPAGRIEAANPTLVRMLGYPNLDSFLETDVHSLYAELSDRQQLLEEIDQSGVAHNLEYQLCRYDGTRIWVKEHARAVLDAAGAVLCYEGCLEEITKRKQAEEALRKEIDFSTSLLDASPTFFVAISAEGKTLMMNEAMLTTLGYTKEEVVGAKYLETLVPEPDRALLAGVFEKLVHLKEPTLNENRVLTRDGRELLIEWRGRPVFKESGELDFFFGVGIDITERRKAEEEKTKVEAQLRHAHKMQAVGQLAAGVAHDFNNILAVVLGHAERSLSKMRDDQTDSIYAVALREIVKSVERGTALVRRLLTFGRASAGKPQLLDLKRVVGGMETMLRSLIGDQIELKITSAPAIKPIKADAGQTEEVIINLILNARDAMPDGGRLTIETADVTYAGAHNEAEPGSYTMLAVSDTGVGMNEETLQRLFEPFFSTKPVDKGTGLGLSIVHGIVTQAGGHVEVTSEPGKGATFKIYFPTAG